MSLVGELAIDADADAAAGRAAVSEQDATAAATAAAAAAAVEDSAEMDARVAVIMHLQQLQHKQEVMQLLEAHPVTNADTEFRLQLDELVRDHLNTCMALASCSTGSHDNSSHSGPPFGLRRDNSDSHHHLLDLSPEQCHHHHHHHHQYRLVVENGDGEDEEQAERESRENGDEADLGHGLLRPNPAILGRWDERQGSEPTPRERQVREAELLALSSLHTVSTLDASFLQGSPPSPRHESCSVERPQRLSPLVQMWRELEGDAHGENRDSSPLSADRARARGETGAEEAAGEAAAQNWPELEPETNGSANFGIHECQESSAVADDAAEAQVEPPESTPQGSETQVSEQIGSREAEELPTARSEAFTQEDASGSSNRSTETEGNRSEGRELDGERERVQQMVQRWMRESGVADSEGAENARPSSRVEWMAEGERERVRQMAREWVQVSNFDAGSPRPSSQRQQEAGLSTNGVSRQQHHEQQQQQQLQRQRTGQEASSLGDVIRAQHSRVGWDDPQQRHLILELLMRSEQERQRELVGISEHRTVSAFAHRSRLQSFLRGRFLRNGVRAGVERPPSSAAGEIGQLRQQRAVSGLREGFRFRLETIVRGQGNPPINDGSRRQQETPQHVVQQANRQTASPSESGVFQDHPAPRRAQWTHELQSLEEATAYNMELRELLARQSVTTVLASDFRDRLDQLIRSFIHTQGRTPQPWNTSRPPRQAPSGAQQAHQAQQHGAGDRERRASVSEAPNLVIPPPPPPPPHPLWQDELMDFMVGPRPHPPPVTWPRPAPRRSAAAEMEWETTSRALRADVNTLQRGMNEMRELMESSMQMQFELQRSIRQEISGALQRMYVGKEIPDEALNGSKWSSVKKGTCCICCDKQIDCLLYRCGHMCTCVKCASELHKNSGRCPMCRASILEVVRAFTVT